MSRVVTNLIVTDQISSKTANDPINITESIEISAGKQLQCDTIVSRDTTNEVIFPIGIISPDIRVSSIHERVTSAGIVLQHPTTFADTITVMDHVRSDSFRGRSSAEVISTDNLSLGATRLLSANRLASVSGTLAVESGLTMGANLLTAATAQITNLAPSTGANVFLAGSLITDVGTSLTTTDTATDLLRHRTVEPILCVSTLELNTGKKIVTPRMDCEDFWGVGAGRIKVKAGLNIELVPNQSNATRILALNDSDQVVSRVLEPTIKWEEKFTEGYATISNLIPASGAGAVLALHLDQQWRINHSSNTTASEIKSLFNFAPTRDTSARFGILPLGTGERKFWMSNSFCPTGDFTWDLTFNLTHVTHERINSHKFFLGMGVLPYINTGEDLDGICGLLFQTNQNTNQWMIISGGRGAAQTDIALTSTAVTTSLINLKIIITRLGVNAAATIKLNDVDLINGLVLPSMGLDNLKFGSKFLVSTDANDVDGFPLAYGLNLYNLKIY